MVILGNGLEHGLGELHMTVLVFAVRVSGRVVNRVNKLLEPSTLRVGERPGGVVSARHVDIHGCDLVVKN